MPHDRATISRRRVLTLFAIGAGAAGLGMNGPVAEEEWRGAALGAQARLVFAGASPESRARAVAETLAEIERLEAIFSLERQDSEISRLNARGRLDLPSQELVELLHLCRRVHDWTSGLFDPTVQPLWTLFMNWHARGGPGSPPQALVDEALRNVGFGKVDVQPTRIALAAGVALTLNGIAQGYITDRVAQRLRALGFHHVLIDLGEIRVLGGRNGGEAWRIGVPGVRDPLHLRDGAIATSAAAATPIGANGDHHLFDPRTGRPCTTWTSLSIRHASAAVADGLSTGLYAANLAQLRSALGEVPGASAWACAPEAVYDLALGGP